VSACISAEIPVTAVFRTSLVPSSIETTSLQPIEKPVGTNLTTVSNCSQMAMEKIE